MLPLLGLVASCGPIAGQDEPPPTVLSSAEEVAPVDGPRGRGGPHYASIVALWRARDGSVLSKDAGGRLIFWPSLDGDQEPLPLADDVLRAELAPRPGGWMVAAVTTGGWGLDLYTIRAQGLAENPVLPSQVERRRLGLGAFVEDAVVVDEGVLLLLADGSLRWAADGRDAIKLPAVESPTINRLRRTPDGVVFALSREEDPQGTKVTLRELSLAPEGKAGAEDAFTFVMPHGFEPWQFALSGNGNLLAHSANAGVVLRRRGSDQVERFPYDPCDPAPTLGFVGADHLVITQGEAPNHARSHLLNVETGMMYPRLSPAHAWNGGAEAGLGFTAVHAADLRVLGYGPHLYVDHPLEAGRQSPVFVGYRPLRPASVALSPDESRIAWGGPGQIDIEDAEGMVLYALDTHDRLPTWMTFLDTDTLAVSWNRADLSIINVGSEEAGDNLVLTSLGSRSVPHVRDGQDRVRLVTALRPDRLGYLAIERHAGDWAFSDLVMLDLDQPVSGFGLDANSLWAHFADHLEWHDPNAVQADMFEPNASTAELGRPVLVDGAVRVVAVDGDNPALIRSVLGEAPLTWPASSTVDRLLAGPAQGELDYAILGGEDLSIVALDRKSWAPRWTSAWPSHFGASVAIGTQLIVVADVSGGKVLDATTGAVLRRRCGGEFGRYRTALDPAVTASEGLCAE